MPYRSAALRHDFIPARSNARADSRRSFQRALGTNPHSIRRHRHPLYTGRVCGSHGPEQLVVTVGKSLSIDSPVTIKRVAIANNSLAETVVIGPKEVLINGLAPGETSLIIWQEDDVRLVYDLLVRASSRRLDAVREQIAHEFPDANVELTSRQRHRLRPRHGEGHSRGGKGYGDRFHSWQAGQSAARGRPTGGAANPIKGAVRRRGARRQHTAFHLPGERRVQSDFGCRNRIAHQHRRRQNFLAEPGNQRFSVPQGPQSRLGFAASCRAKACWKMLAEPNLLVINGTTAHFLAGGEFPYPMVQPGGGSNSISIAFKEYGIKLGFLPVVTPRGTIRLQVSPEVSALDYTNSVTIAGTTVPGTSMRRVQTEVEFESGQSFVIAGLLDNQTTESFSKVPGLGDIPLLGKLFQSKSLSRNHTELLVIITPEIVRPIPADRARAEPYLRRTATAPRLGAAPPTGYGPDRPRTGDSAGGQHAHGSADQATTGTTENETAAAATNHRGVRRIVRTAGRRGPIGQ